MHRRAFLGSSTALSLAWATGSGQAHVDYDTFARQQRAPLQPDGGVKELVRMAVLAPSGHNAQPWLFASDGCSLRLRPDLSRRTPVVDPDDHHLYVSLGAAVENMKIAGAPLGMPGDADGGADGSIAYRWAAGTSRADPLVDAIPRRQSTRTEYDGSRIDAATLAALLAAGRRPGVRLVALTTPAARAAVRDLVTEGTARQMEDAAFVAELKHWLRFSAGRAMRDGDGLYAAATGSPAMPEFIGGLAFDLFFRKGPERDRYARQMDSSSTVVVFFGERADAAHWIAVGRAAQRLLLEATRAGLACAFVNQPVEVPSLRAQLAALAGEPALRPDVVIRIGRSTALPWSPRRPVSDVLAPSTTANDDRRC